VKSGSPLDQASRVDAGFELIARTQAGSLKRPVKQYGQCAER
jgi:hypothetical protein